MYFICTQFSEIYFFNFKGGVGSDPLGFSSYGYSKNPKLHIQFGF